METIEWARGAEIGRKLERTVGVEGVFRPLRTDRLVFACRAETDEIAVPRAGAFEFSTKLVPAILVGSTRPAIFEVDVVDRRFLQACHVATTPTAKHGPRPRSEVARHPLRKHHSTVGVPLGSECFLGEFGSMLFKSLDSNGSNIQQFSKLRWLRDGFWGERFRFVVQGFSTKMITHSL